MSATNNDASPAAADEQPLRYAHSEGFAELLRQVDASLWITTYQGGKLIVLRPRGARLSMIPRTFDRAMGLALSPRQVALGTRSHVWFLENDSRLVPQLSTAANHGGCFVPRRAHVTGDFRGHELAWATDPHADGDEPALWIVNTLFSCLCTLDARHSFVPRWQPAFIDAIAGEDRCHLNGVALRDGRPRYVTALGATNEPEGWRERRLDGGCVLDVDTSDVVCAGLCMPHSPRWYNERLWCLNSGRGELLCLDVARGRTEVVTRFRGYPRGLALRGGLAFVGLSQARESAVFGGLPLTEQGSLVCGVSVVELSTGRIVGELEFQGAIAEIFDVQLLPRVLDPLVIGIEKETFHAIFSLPAPDSGRGEARPSTVHSSPRGPTHEPRASDIACSRLGRVAAPSDGVFPADVYYLRYRSTIDDGAWQAAKLFVPVGQPPRDGWPLCIWCHGLGDPATQLHRWPLQETDWRVTRGRLAGRWAHWGFSVLAPWMPGDGPSEPHGTYSPLSLARNGRAVIDAITTLERLVRGADWTPASAHPNGAEIDVDSPPSIDLDRQVLHTTCVAAPLLVHLAALANIDPRLTGLKAYIADDFQPGIAHCQACLGPRLDSLPARDAVAVRMVWLRVLWALFEYEGFPPLDLVSRAAHEFLAEPIDTPVGPLKRVFAQPLVPATASTIAEEIVRRMESSANGTSLSGAAVTGWLWAAGAQQFFRSDSLEATRTDPFYRRYLAPFDPFFEENIAPFRPRGPLLVVRPNDRAAGDVPGLPNQRERFEYMTQPKLQTLRSWGWDVRVSPSESSRIMPVLDAPIRDWLLEQLAGVGCR